MVLILTNLTEIRHSIKLENSLIQSILYQCNYHQILVTLNLHYCVYIYCVSENCTK